MKKKLQVFVSSTYTDLIDERQAAVEAILDAGHIPAGMELFKAGNESQLKTIYKWIDESDVYMLILGGRYGSIESKSGKSYTQLEYEYALNKNIPVFALILSESFLTNKINTFNLGLSNIVEQKAPDKYQSFKSLVMSKIIREVDDCKDIKIQVHVTLNEFSNTYNLIGWVRNNNENDIIQLLKDNTNLLKENNLLNKQIQELQEQLKSKEQFGKFTFNQLTDILKNKFFTMPENFFDQNKNITINALTFFTIYYKHFCTGIPNSFLGKEECEWIFVNICPYFLGLKLIKKDITHNNKQYYEIDTFGTSFYAELEINGYME